MRAPPPIAASGRGISPAVAELAAIPRWVTWRAEQRNGKVAKVPYIAGGRRRASSTDPATWSPFDDCFKCAFVDGAATGIGIVVDGSDDLMAADLDQCIYESGVVMPWARIVVRMLGSYTERSPSGKGLRVFFHGAMIDKGRKVRFRDGHLELYRAERYLTVTGNHLEGTPETINHVEPDVIAELLAESPAPNGEDTSAKPVKPAKEISDELRDKLSEAMADDPALWAVWNGELPAGEDHSRSAFDFKLAGALRRHDGFTVDDFATLARWWEYGKGVDGDPRHWRRCWERTKPPPRRKEEPYKPPVVISSLELMATEFDPVRWVVPGLLPEGLALDAGKPKIGKSWLELDRGIAVATGGLHLGHYECEAGAVLILSLEDSPRRMKDRLHKLGFKGHANLDISVEWPRLDKGALEEIERWLDAHQNARLVVIDTLAKIRTAGIANKDAYQADSDALRGLHRIANERGVAIQVVHHLRKSPAEDWVDEISGTAGIGGVPDTIAVLKRERGQADAFLFGTGRDVQDYEIALKFDEKAFRWRKLNMSIPEARATSEQTAIIEALRSVAPAGLMRHQIASMTGHSKTGTSNMLRRMENAGIVERKDTFWHLTC